MFNSLEQTHPHLLEEWDYEKNDENNIVPNKISAGSSKCVFWICSKNPEHKWKIDIRGRTSRFSGCPDCKMEENNLAIKFPHLLEEWDYEKNTISPSNIGWCVPKKVFWICSKNKEHKWYAKISLRTLEKNPRGCPFCRGLKVNHTNCFSTTHPHLLEEWDYEKNIDLRIHPNEITANSNKRIFWICSKNPEHKWGTTINNRTNKKSGCPKCCLSRSFSIKEKDFIEKLRFFCKIPIEENRKGLFEGRRFEFDGWCELYQIGFEFQGEYWHSREEIKKRDIEKRKISKKKGYKIIYVLEKDWDKNPERCLKKIKKKIESMIK